MLVGCGGGDTVSLEIKDAEHRERDGPVPWQCERCLSTFRERSGRVGPYFLEEDPDRALCASCCRAILRGGPSKRVHEILEEAGLWPLPRRPPGGT